MYPTYSVTPKHPRWLDGIANNFLSHQRGAVKFMNHKDMLGPSIYPKYFQLLPTPATTKTACHLKNPQT